VLFASGVIQTWFGSLLSALGEARFDEGRILFWIGEPRIARGKRGSRRMNAVAQERMRLRGGERDCPGEERD
jgi:hypothetical protein